MEANHRHVTRDGSVYLPYLNKWDPRNSSLDVLATILSSVFSELPPVRAKPSGVAAGPSCPIPSPVPAAHTSPRPLQTPRPPRYTAPRSAQPLILPPRPPRLLAPLLLLLAWAPPLRTRVAPWCATPRPACRRSWT